MKNLLVSIICIIFFSTTVFGDVKTEQIEQPSCDWSKGIKKLDDGTYSYTLECHELVGKLVEDSKIKEQQINDLNKAVKLKDLSLEESEKRANGWNETSKELESRIQAIDKMEKTNEIILFGAGVVATILVGFMLSSLVGK